MLLLLLKSAELSQGLSSFDFLAYTDMLDELSILCYEEPLGRTLGERKTNLSEFRVGKGLQADAQGAMRIYRNEEGR
jgi:hypothetical protein